MGQGTSRAMCNRLPRVAERLDEERLEILRTWGTGLSTSGRDGSGRRARRSSC